VRLDQLECGTAAQISSVDWSQLEAGAGRRLRELGFDEGVTVRALHKAPFGHDPLAIEVGRMIIAMRRAVAQTVSVTIAGAGTEESAALA
jgi:ferrous iron transport protein A